ncbi:MAG: helix-hairpin-helix domain-containing protein [Crocinitomicaceae bacterium]|nr:helix-hairpin-helix domain-containing protein [Flavobacteriales bacterium]NQZ37221.1 helix-hairpin-helix domain-containing protein [Crocinitomicaceae bacterium]
MPISKRNRRAVLGVLMLVAVISFLPRLMAEAVHFSDDDVSFEKVKIAENNIEERQEFWAKKKRKKYDKSSYKKRFKKPKSKFDPNTYKIADWMMLGLSEKQAAIVVRLSGRGFNSNADLERIFVLPKPAYELLKDSTFYPRPMNILSYQRNESSPDKSKVSVNLNGGSHEEFERIRGIGSYFSKKIIDYRERLGGYIHKEQLLEIWKIDLVKYQEIEEFIYFGSEPVEKISINKASVEMLSKHPYINYKMANSIVKMRAQSGDYNEVKEIKRSKLIDEVTFVKIKPYLSL